MADSRFGHAAHAAGVVGGAALRPLAAAATLGGRLERNARKAAVSGMTEAALLGLDTFLASRLAAETVDRALASALARRAVSRALEGPIVEAVTRDVIRCGVLERVAGELVDSDALEQVAGTVLASGAVDAMVERVLADGVVEQTAARLLEGPELERVVTSAVDSPAMERLVARVVESKLVDEAVERLLSSDELWLFVDEIAHSPAVTDAIAQQSMSFADQVAGGMRVRSRNADAWIESKVRRALRRRPAAQIPADGGIGGDDGRTPGSR
jgi:uncharacterized membrane-anchored protein YjiN (DUF445 family)